MQENRDKFQNFKDILKSSLSIVSYNAWFDQLELYDLTDDTLILKTDLKDRRDYLLKFYILNHVFY